MRNHLPGFLISLLLHAGLFSLFISVFTIQTSVNTDEEPIALKLSMFVPPAPVIEPTPVITPDPEPVVEEPPPEPPPPKVVKKPKPKPKPKPKKKPRPKPVVKKVDTEPVEEIKPVTDPSPVAVALPQPVIAPPPQAPVQSKVINEYKTALRRAIEANKHYPRQARRLRQQGTAVVAFTVLRDGSIQNLRITSSAGNRSLDKAALKAIEKINGKFPIPDELNKPSWDFDIPMQYSLL